MYSSIIFLIVLFFLGSSLVLHGYAIEKIVPFEKRLSVQLSNNSNTSNFANDATLLDMPRNSTIEQINSNNQTVNQIYNNSIQTMGEGSEKTRQNISEILSLLK